MEAIGLDPVELSPPVRRYRPQSNPLGELAKRLLAHPDGVVGSARRGGEDQSSLPPTLWTSTSRRCCELRHLRLCHRPPRHFASNGSAPVPLRFGADMTLSGHAVIDRLSRALPGLAADMLEIAASVYAIDRLAPPADVNANRPAGDGVGTIPVGGHPCPRTGPVAAAEIPPTQPAAALADRQRLVLGVQPASYRCRSARPRHSSSYSTPCPDGAVPVLFSGGLDSAAGLALELVHQ